MKKTLFDKIWEQHVVDTVDGGRNIIYIDKHFIHEVTSPQAFAGLEKRGVPLFRKEKILATADHNVPTLNQHLPIVDPLSRTQVNTLIKNCEKFGVELYGLGHQYQGIVHVIGPELGITRPGMTIVCGDSHTSTHGAFGALAFGIGTSEVEHVLATQTLIQSRAKNFKISVDGKLPLGVTAKDVILSIIGKIGTAGGTGYVIEYCGEVFRNFSMEERMTVCNMSIEAGARAGLVAPDQKTFDYIKGRPLAPKGDNWEKALKYWSALYTDKDEKFYGTDINNPDTDGDGYGSSTSIITSSAQPEGFVVNDLDCDDSDADIRPWTKELEDGRDNNCNDQIDEGFIDLQFYLDSDGDGFTDYEEVSSGTNPLDSLNNDDANSDDSNGSEFSVPMVMPGTLFFLFGLLVIIRIVPPIAFEPYMVPWGPRNTSTRSMSFI